MSKYKMYKKIIYLMFFSCLLSENLFGAETDWNKYFDDWVEIPREILDQREIRNKQRMPNADVGHWEMGFQKKSNFWFSFPNILVQIHDSKNPDNEVMEMFNEAKTNKSKVIDNIKDESNGTLSIDGIWEPQYDNVAKATIVKTRINGPNGPIISILIMKSFHGKIYQYSGSVIDGTADSMREVLEIQKFILKIK